MMFCAVKDPTAERITILVAIVVGYALYHLIRWYLARSKVEKEEIGRGQENSSTKDVIPPLSTSTSNLQPPPSPSPSSSPQSPSTPSEDALFTPEEIRKFEQMGRKAWSSGWLIEAHLWTTLARANGVHGLSSRLDKMERDWVAQGSPDEAENIHPGYNSTHAALAIAYMLFRTGMAPRENAAYIVRQARMHRRMAISLARYERLITH